MCCNERKIKLLVHVFLRKHQSITVATFLIFGIFFFLLFGIPVSKFPVFYEHNRERRSGKLLNRSERPRRGGVRSVE